MIEAEIKKARKAKAEHLGEKGEGEEGDWVSAGVIGGGLVLLLDWRSPSKPCPNV
jgi:hypothetical protein